MKTLLAAVTLVAALAHPAAAVTFPSLTTIYVGAMFHCANVSGGTVTLRILLLSRAGEVVATHSVTYFNGQTYGLSTRNTATFTENANLGGPGIQEGVVNIGSTNSAVFCTAKAVDPAAVSPKGFAFPLVRVNPHPGTVE